MKPIQLILMGASAITLCATAVPAYAQTWNIQSATANQSHRGFPASNAIDGDLSFASRWAGSANPEQLILDLGTSRTVNDVQIAFTAGDRIRYPFIVESRNGTSGNWTEILEDVSGGNTDNFETFDVRNISARQVRITGLRTGTTNITEVRVIGPNGPAGTPPPTAGPLNIVSASANHNHRSFPPSNAINGNTDFASRWAGRSSPERLTLDLGSNQEIGDVQIAWGRGDGFSYSFMIEARTGTSGSWTELFNGRSSGNTDSHENYNVSDMTARQVRISGTDGNWSNITDVRIIGTGGSTDGNLYGIAPNGIPFCSPNYSGNVTLGGETPPLSYGYEDTDSDGVAQSCVIQGAPGGGDGTSLTHFGVPITSVGANIAYAEASSFSMDFGGYSDLNINRYSSFFSDISNSGGNSARIWLHASGELTPNVGANGRVQSLGRVGGANADERVLEQMESVLDAAWNEGILVTFSLFSFDMLCDNHALNFNDNNRGVADESLRNKRDMLGTAAGVESYIDNALVPMVERLRGHPALFAWEIFNEPEGMIPNRSGAPNFCEGQELSFPTNLGAVQRFVNQTAAAIHSADPNVKVTTSTTTEFFEDYSNATLRSLPGANPNGTLDFYELHWYRPNGFQQANPPFFTSTDVYDNDAPIIIGEFSVVDATEEFVPSRDSISTILSQGYAGAWPWSLQTARETPERPTEYDDILSAINNAGQSLTNQQRTSICNQTNHDACD